MNNLLYYLAFNRMENVGPRTVKKLREHWPDLSALFKLSASQLEKAGLSPALALKISRFNMKQVEPELKWHEGNNQHILCWDDALYPPLLAEIYDPPPVLFARGDIDAFQSRKVAMVGTRNPSIHGSETAFRFARSLSQAGITVVSGLALGVDAEAHKGCLASNGRTIAVMATGMDHIYPKRHMTMAEKITEKGLLISEFSLGTRPVAGHFPRRNRIISGLTMCTLVVEAAIKSGSLITARYALEQNREVLAIPGSIHNPKARGCHYLLQQGARLVTSVEEILNEPLLLESDSNCTDVQSKLASGEENLVKFIGFETTTVDQIVQRSGMTVNEVLCQLADLELNEAVKSVPGGYVRNI